MLLNSCVSLLSHKLTNPTACTHFEILEYQNLTFILSWIKFMIPLLYTQIMFTIYPYWERGQMGLSCHFNCNTYWWLHRQDPALGFYYCALKFLLSCWANKSKKVYWFWKCANVRTLYLVEIISVYSIKIDASLTFALALNHWQSTWFLSHTVIWDKMIQFW